MGLIGRTMGLAAVLTVMATTVSGCTTVRRYTGLKAETPRCAELKFPIYFQTGSAALTDPAREMIRTSAAQAKGCKVNQVQVLGLADASGTAARNEELSRERARIVALALAAEGLPAPVFDIDAAGAAGATTARGQADPVRRRTEVIVTFAP